MENTIILEADNSVPEEQVEQAKPDRESILAAAYLPEEWWPDCYIANNGQIFTPQFDADGKVSMTGEQAYQQWLAAKDKPAEAPESAEEQLQQRITDLELSDMEQGQMLTDLELDGIENGQRATDLEIQVLELMHNVQQSKNTL